MPPPPAPSPHRFVIKKQAPVPKTPLPPEQPRPKQFNPTPRFTFSSTPRPTPTQTLPASTPSATRYLTPARHIPKYEDVIENGEHPSDGPFHDSVETEDQDIELRELSGDDEDYKIEEPTPKRRRLSSSLELQDTPLQESEDNELPDELPDSSLPFLSSPPAPRPRMSTTAPRFLLSTPAAISTPQPLQNTPPTFLKPPRFRPPDPSEQAQSQTEPLPEQFSPHRRGQKYMAGGLAAEVRDWLVNIESAIPAQRHKDDPWSVRIVVDEVSGGGKAGMTLIRGRPISVDDGQEMADNLGGVVKVALAGEGAGNGLQKGMRVEVGKTVGIKGPVWEVMIENEKWGVGVDWKVLP